MSLPVFSTMRSMYVLSKTTGSGRQIGSASEVKLEKAYRPCRRNRQGAAAVEFALVAPLFFMMVFGMIELGRAIMVQQVLTNAAREGARYAVLDGSTSADASQKVSDYLRKAGITSGETVTVGEATLPAPAGSPLVITAKEPALIAYGGSVGVRVTIQYSKVTWLPTPWFLGGKELSATSAMRRETVQ